MPASAAAVDPGRVERLRRHAPRHGPDLLGVVLDPARAAGSAGRTRCRPGPPGGPRRRRRWPSSRSCPGRGRGSRAATYRRLRVSCARPSPKEEDFARRRGPHHRNGLEGRVRGRPADRGGRHRGHHRVDEDGDARRGRGRRHGQGDQCPRASRSARATRWSCSSRPHGRAGVGQADPRRARRRGRAAADLQRGAPGRARPRDPRHAGGDRRRPRRPLPGAHAARGQCSPPATTSATCRARRFEEQAEQLVAHPFHDAIEALDAYPYPVDRGSSTATRSAAAWSWR